MTDPAALTRTAGRGWKHLPPNPGHLLRGCFRPQRINGAEASHFLCPGDRPHHTVPHCRHPYLRKFRLPHPEEAAGPHTPGLTSLYLLEAGELGRLGSRQALIRLPIRGESGPYLRGGGTVEEGA